MREEPAPVRRPEQPARRGSDTIPPLPGPPLQAAGAGDCRPGCPGGPCRRAPVTTEGRKMPGPLQVIAVSFGPGADFEGRVLAEVDRLQGRGVIRLVDLLFVAKNDDGEIERLGAGDDSDFRG